jgi:outer membrane protein assembly factor BamB
MVRAIAMCLAAMCVGGLGDDASTLGTGPLGIKGYRNDWTGRYPNADPVTAWDLEKGINVLWKLPTRNYGNGGPLVVGNRLIFVVEPAQLVCVDKMNGKLLWTSTGADPTTYDGLKAPEGVPVSQRPMKYGDHGGLTYATPVTDGKRLWAKLSGVAVCFELATGKRLWETSLHVEPGDHPHNVASPLLVDNVLVCQGGKGDYWPKNSTNQIAAGVLETAYKGSKISPKTQWMVGLDATTGAILWDVGPMNAGGYGVGGTPAPVVVDCNGKKRKFIVTSEGCAIDPANGRLLIPWVGARNGNTAPWPWGDKIVIGDLIVQFKCSADGKLEIADTRKGGGGGGVYHGGRVYS